jgi:hypothetical protein
LFDRTVVALNVVLSKSTKGIMLDRMRGIAHDEQHRRAKHQSSILFIAAKRHRQTEPLESVTIVGRA